MLNKDELPKLKRVYNNILDLISEAKTSTVFNDGIIKEKIENQLFAIKLVEEYGYDISLKSISNHNWNSIGNHLVIGTWNNNDRKISWEDNGKQPNPEGEKLLMISFPTGAYIFGEHYPESIFNKFFEKLKTYNPKYIDTANSCLYYSIEGGGKIFNEFYKLLNQYKELDEKEQIENKHIKIKENIERLQEELKNLK